MKRSLILLLIVLFTSCTTQQSKKRDRSQKLSVIKADFPTAMQFRKDGTLLFTEKNGRLMELLVGARHAVPLLKVNVPDVKGYTETGLLGIALKENDEENVYLYHTYSKNDELFNRVIKINLKTKKISIILDGIKGNFIHNGGKIVFGPDGMLYIETGDAGNSEDAQNKNSLNGKILRIKPDGSIPKDNPFGNPVWSLGHRNMFGLTFDNKKQLFATENGTIKDDEINRIIKGGNYGWPIVLGNENGKFIKPVKTYTIQIAPTGIVFVESLAGLKNKLIIGSYLDEEVISLNTDGTGSKVIASNQGKITDLAVSPDNKVFAATETDIHEVKISR